MSRAIRTIGVAAMCCMLLVVMTACETTGAKSCPGDCSKCPSACSEQAAAPQCGMEGCDKPADPAIKAMVGGKEVCFCCAKCKTGATQK